MLLAGMKQQNSHAQKQNPWKILQGFLTIFVITFLCIAGSSIVQFRQRYNFRKNETASPAAFCEPTMKPNILYLKTHKSGSSTLFNIFMRKAYKENMFVGLPKTGFLFNYKDGSKFNESMMRPPPEGKRVNLLANHMAFNNEQVKKVLGPNTAYISILRDPATQFESTFYYYRDRVTPFLRVDDHLGVEEYVRLPDKYFHGRQDALWWFGKNGAMYDFGMDNLSENETYIDQEINKVDQIFDLVLITEYFDMGLILLKQLLCWEMEDIIYLSMSVRVNKRRLSINPQVIKNIYKWNKADTKLYHHFNNTFWKKVRKYGKRKMENEVKLLQILKDRARNYCTKGTIANNLNSDVRFKIGYHAAADTLTYKLKPRAKYNKTCLSYLLPEEKWRNRFLRMQYPPPHTKDTRVKFPSGFNKQ